MGAPGTGLKYIGGKNQQYVSNKMKHVPLSPALCPICLNPMPRGVCPNQERHEANARRRNAEVQST